MTRTKAASLLVPFALALSLSACEDHTEGVSRATVQDDAEDEAPVEAPSAEVQELAFAAARSSVGFTGAKVTGSHEGRFERFSGAIHFDPRGMEHSRVRVTIEMASVVTDAARLTGHLQTDDFFDVESHPQSTFETTRIVAGAEGAATHTITGRLTMRGRTQTISFPATLGVTDAEIRARAEFVIDRQQFGINYAGAADDLIRDEVVIRFDVVAPRAS